jgi:hypothetical protein
VKAMSWWLAALAGLGAGAGAGCGQVTPNPGSASDAGGNDTAGDAAGAAAIQQACGHLAQASCAKRLSCTSSVDPSGVNIMVAFGDLGTCMAREITTCVNGLSAPQSGNDPALVEQCVTAYANYSCVDFFNNNPPAACAAMGARAAGAPCAFTGQCASGYCAGAKNALCGTCAAAPAPGASCASSTCGHQQICVDTTLLCQPYGALGAACDADDPCGNGLFCTGAVVTTATMGTCQSAISQAGAACGGLMPGCNGAQGLFCGGTVGTKTCMPIAYVGDGLPCGNISTTSFALCQAGGCYTGTGVILSGQTGTCKADVKIDGGACDAVLGPACMTPARCVSSGGGSAGTCVTPTGATCG